MCKIIFYVLIIVILPLSSVKAQTIELLNSSFEGKPAASTTPEGWHNCGLLTETPPDIQPNKTFKVVKTAYEGETYMGLVTRETETWESVAQQLYAPLKKGKCYYFSLYLARSESYESRLRTEEIVSFTQPIKFRIWAGKNYCDKKELLAQTFAVKHTEWREYKFKLSPDDDYDYIMFEAYYVTPTLIPYCGNILVDNCSLILAGPCESEEFSDYQKYPKQR